MTELPGSDVLETGNLVRLFQSLLAVHGHYEQLFLALLGGQVVGWYAVSPPELAADAPVVDVLQPVAVGGDVLLGIELDVTVQHGRQCNVGKVLHGQIPLHAQAGFYGCVGVALGISHLVGVVLHLLHESCFLQVLGNLLAHIHAVHAHVEACCLAECAVGVEDVYGLQVVGLAQVVVVHVVGGSNLQTACTELYLDIAVLDNGNNAAHQGYRHLVAFEPLVLGVLGVDAHGGIAHDGLGTCGGHHGIVSALLVLMQYLALTSCGDYGVGVGICHIVAQVVEVALLLAVDNLYVGKGCLCLGVPVYHAQTAVDESLLVQVAEHLQHALAACLVHGEGGAVPVA